MSHELVPKTEGRLITRNAADVSSEMMRDGDHEQISKG